MVLANLGFEVISHRLSDLNTILDQIWIIICTVMVLLSQVGYMMRETGSIKMHNNSTILLKTILVISVSSISYFFVGYALSTEAKGGLLGQSKFIGTNLDSNDHCRFVYFVSLCVKMSVIATGSIGERVKIDIYIFFSFLTSSFIFPLGLAWCWNDGWLQNLGFIDYGGVAIVHVMGGLAGYMGTLMIGPRVGLFSPDTKLRYILDEEKFLKQREEEEEKVL